MSTIAENIANIRARMNEAAKKAGRDPSEILLCAATKMNDADRVKEAVAAGVDCCGENRVQEIQAKRPLGAYTVFIDHAIFPCTTSAMPTGDCKCEAPPPIESANILPQSSPVMSFRPMQSIYTICFPIFCITSAGTSFNGYDSNVRNFFESLSLGCFIFFAFNYFIDFPGYHSNHRNGNRITCLTPNVLMGYNYCKLLWKSLKAKQLPGSRTSDAVNQQIVV